MGMTNNFKHSHADSVRSMLTITQPHTFEGGMAAHSSILAWRTPMDRGAWWATVMGSHRVGHDRSDSAPMQHLQDPGRAQRPANPVSTHTKRLSQTPFYLPCLYTQSFNLLWNCAVRVRQPPPATGGYLNLNSVKFKILFLGFTGCISIAQASSPVATASDREHCLIAPVF